LLAPQPSLLAPQPSFLLPQPSFRVSSSDAELPPLSPKSSACARKAAQRLLIRAQRSTGWPRSPAERSPSTADATVAVGGRPAREGPVWRPLLHFEQDFIAFRRRLVTSFGPRRDSSASLEVSRFGSGGRSRVQGRRRAGPNSADSAELGGQGRTRRTGQCRARGKADGRGRGAALASGGRLRRVHRRVGAADGLEQ
jgi:hypothetical protein